MTRAKELNTAKGLSIEKMSTTCGRGRVIAKVEGVTQSSAR